MKSGFPTFQLSRLIILKDGSTRTRRPPLQGAFSIQILGARKYYAALAKLLLRFSEEKLYDSEHHRHFDKLISHDGSVRVDLVLRKDDIGSACWRMELKDDDSSQRSAPKKSRRRLTKR